MEGLTRVQREADMSAVTRSQRLMKHGEPRALPEHRNREGYAYRIYCQRWLARVNGAMAPTTLSVLREAALTALDLGRLRTELEALRARRGAGVRRKEERRLRSEIRKTRIQLLLFERRLEAEAKGNGHHPPTIAELVAQRRANG